MRLWGGASGGDTYQFTSQVYDANGNLTAGSTTWSVSGGGTIDGTGLFTSDGSEGSFTVTATAGGLTTTVSVRVSGGAAAPYSPGTSGVFAGAGCGLAAVSPRSAITALSFLFLVFSLALRRRRHASSCRATAPFSGSSRGSTAR